MVAPVRPRLILIKHAKPIVDPQIAASEWVLSDEGRASCARLSAALVPFAPATFFTSPQPKAAQTAGLVSASFGTSTTIREALREHDERDAPFFDDEAAFVRAVETFFVRPNERVFGAESAHEALARFSVEVDGLVSTAAGPVAVVSHGRVISLYIGERAGVNAFGVWRRLALPSFVVFDPELRAIVHLASPI